MKITESTLRQIVREEIKKLFESPVTFSASLKADQNLDAKEKVDIENKIAEMSPEDIEKLKRLAILLSQQLQNLEIKESKQELTLQEPKTIAKKVVDLFKDEETGELNVPAMAVNALILVPMLTMKGEPGVAAASMGVGVLLDLINNVSRKISSKIMK